LSFPGIFEKIDRPSKITVEAQDPEGNKIKIEAEDFLAIVLQHEIDHLNGVVFIDRMSPARRIMHGKELKELKTETKNRIKDK
ncbi:MAG TPA: peptide deformylase, partial [Candidatus Goldiibacteriota bacterium]|nr:peptide deformylase [Candidatus Goldiibacteriota bacterium]